MVGTNNLFKVLMNGPFCLVLMNGPFCLVLMNGPFCLVLMNGPYSHHIGAITQFEIPWSPSCRGEWSALTRGPCGRVSSFVGPSTTWPAS
jgi:hypothetical protein